MGSKKEGGALNQSTSLLISLKGTKTISLASVPGESSHLVSS